MLCYAINIQVRPPTSASNTRRCRRFSRKRCEICRWNVNRRSWRRIEWYHFRRLWMTPNPDVKVTVYVQVEYLKNGAF